MALPPDVLANLKANIQKAEASIPNLQAEISRLQRSGQDATAYNTRLVAVQQQIQKAKLTYPEAFQ